jgi:hypothetical protein
VEEPLPRLFFTFKDKTSILFYNHLRILYLKHPGGLRRRKSAAFFFNALNSLLQLNAQDVFQKSVNQFTW